MAEAIRLRYPANQLPTATSGVSLLPVNESDGWLADQSTWKSGLTQIASYNQYPGNKQTAGWLLNDNVAYLYRAFSSYDHDVRLDFAQPLQFPSPFQLEVNVGYAVPTNLKLQLDLSGTPGWTKVEIFNGAQSILQRVPSTTLESALTLDVPINRWGVYGFSALVTHSDGHTISTTNLLGFTAVPEPTTVCSVIVGLILVGLWTPRGVLRRDQARS